MEGPIFVGWFWRIEIGDRDFMGMVAVAFVWLVMMAVSCPLPSLIFDWKGGLGLELAYDIPEIERKEKFHIYIFQSVIISPRGIAKAFFFLASQHS